MCLPADIFDSEKSKTSCTLNYHQVIQKGVNNLKTLSFGVDFMDSNRVCTPP